MVIECEIKLYKDSAVFNAGDIVSGLITYKVEDEKVFSKITVSLKGNGHIVIKYKQESDNMFTQRKREEYIDMDYIIYKNENGEKLKGTYQKEFNFVLPEMLPPTLKLAKKTVKNHVYCWIYYYIRIKFQQAGIINNTQKFQKQIKVNSIVKPRFSTEPKAYVIHKRLQQFSWKKNVIKINALIDKSVNMPGDKIKIDFEIENDTNFNIRGILIKLIQLYIFKANRRKVKMVDDVKGTLTHSRSDFIAHGETQRRNAEIIVPELLGSIEYSNLIFREYLVTVTLELPKPRDDVVFEFPIQIIDDKPPPAYWEALQDINDELVQEMNVSDDDRILNSDEEETTSL